MLGKKPIGLGLLVAVTAMVAMAFSAVTASAFAPRLLDQNGGNPLRELASIPTNQPDAGEFVNSTVVELKTTAGTIKCNEIEFGTIVKSNAGGGKNVVLTVPFGVAEAGDGAVGDTGCNVGGTSVPTYFDTNNAGVVGTGVANVATVEVNKAGVAAVQNLAFSQNIPGVGFCTGTVSGKTGMVANAVGAFGEETGENLNVAFNTKVPISGTGCVAALGAEAALTGTFRLETPSTATEGWWLE